MYLVEKNYEETFYQSNIFNFYFGSLKIGVLDIETTGLSPDKSSFILGGLLTPRPDGVKVQQFFSDSKEEEPSLLTSYLSELRNIDVLISYNGDNFDLPFLNRRLKLNGLFYGNHPSSCLPMYQSLDLYRILDRYSTLRKLLPNLKQKTVETFMGLWSDRADAISGAESVELYYNYLRTGDLGIRETILLHNMDDVLQLSRLMKILEKLDLHRILFHVGFIASWQDKKIYIKKIELKKDFIIILGEHKNIPMDYRYYGVSHEARISTHNGDFKLKIPYKSSKGFCYIDLDEFSMDFSDLGKYSGYQSGYLIIKEGTQLHYAEINHLIKLILEEILKEF